MKTKPTSELPPEPSDGGPPSGAASCSGPVWTVEATGWVGLCPVWIADVDSDAPVPIPRPLWLGWWLAVQWWMQDFANWCLSAVNPYFQPGYAIHHVRDIEPFEMQM